MKLPEWCKCHHDYECWCKNHVGLWLSIPTGIFIAWLALWLSGCETIDYLRERNQPVVVNFGDERLVNYKAPETAFIP
jgi:hypothetical protein